jgi:hypothetical protein
VTPTPLPRDKLREPVVGGTIGVVPGCHGGREEEADGPVAFHFEVGHVGEADVDSGVGRDVANSLGEAVEG